jgi:hypothetical protein
MSAIAEIVALLTLRGISAEFHGEFLDLAQRHVSETMEILRNSAEIPRNSAENAYERRLRKDRERKRKIAENSAESAETASYILTSLSNTSSEETLKEVSKERIRARARPKKQLGPLPEDWQPDAGAFALAAETGVELDAVEARFRDYLKSTGKQYADYDAALRTFIRNTPKFNGNHGAGNGRRTVHDAAKDLTRRLRALDEPPPSELRGGEGGSALRLVPPRGRE